MYEYVTKYDIIAPKRGDKMATVQEQIKMSCIHANMTMTELAKAFGISQSGFSQRVKTGKFSREEMERIASILGCDYVSYFEFPDGKKY